jgi:c-di-GMP-binding flagellar brake protein YcgR
MLARANHRHYYVGNFRDRISQQNTMDNTYSEEELERCTLRNPREVIFQLRGMIKRGDRVTVLFQEGRQSFLSVLLDLSESKGLLYIDVGGSNEMNQAFLKSEQSTFTTFVDGVRIQFTAKKGSEVTLNGEKTFAVPIPASMLRLQRREYFRLQLPSTKPYICRIRRGTPQEKALPLHDISVGGVGIHAPQPLDYEPLEKLENCWIDLHDSGVLAVTLEVRYVDPLQSRTGKPFWHLGCRFVNLSPLNETLIQRFMARLEAERKALAA